MSKILDRLERITRGSPRALGFATSANQEPIPSLALLGWTGGSRKIKLAPKMNAGLDAFILSPGGSEVDDLDKQLKPLEGCTWGVVMEQPERERVEAYQSKGCDFLVFDIADTRVDALEEGESARILRVPADLEESVLRGLEDLPVDIILLRKPAPEGPLTLTHLLAVSNVRSATSRYLLVQWDADLTSRELEHLRDMGVDGLVVDVKDSSLVVALRERINSLPDRKPKGDQRPAATLPRVVRAAGPQPQRTEEEEEEEEWDEP